MQSPLTPQRGRIESNPREYTHMGPSTNLPHERGFSDTRAWIFRRPPDERGFSDEIDRKKPKNRPNIHARHLLSLVFHSSLIQEMTDN